MIKQMRNEQQLLVIVCLSVCLFICLLVIAVDVAVAALDVPVTISAPVPLFIRELFWLFCYW